MSIMVTPILRVYMYMHVTCLVVRYLHFGNHWSSSYTIEARATKFDEHSA